MTPSPSYGGKPHEQPREWLDYLERCEKVSFRKVDPEMAKAKAEASQAKLEARREARKMERWQAAREGRVAL